MDSNIKRILISLSFFALSGGIYYNFLELWMKENNMSVNTISAVLSLCALVTVSVIFICSNIIKPHNLKKFVLLLTVIKTGIILSLFLLYKSNYNGIIKLLIMFDYAVDTEIFACIYPLISMINKSNKLYALRKLIYSLSYYFGVILVTYLLGKVVFNYQIDYNTYLFIASLFLIVSIVFLIKTKINVKDNNDKQMVNNDILIKLLKKIKKDNISVSYLLFTFFAGLSHYSIMGVVLLIFTDEIGFVPSTASNIKLVAGIVGVGLGFLVLSKFTFKNNYINIGIKFIGRFITYLLPLIYFSKINILIGFLYTIVTSPVYLNVTDAPYINRFSSEEQLAFSNLKEMMTYLSRALGTYICGLCILFNLKINFICAAVLELLAIVFAYMALYLIDREKSTNDR